MTPTRAELPSLAVILVLIVVVGGAVTVLAVLRRAARSKRSGPLPTGSLWSRRLGGAGRLGELAPPAAARERRRFVAVALGPRCGPHWRHPLADQRDRNGFASAGHLRQEASVAAARRRAPYTRPSLAVRTKRPEAAEVGYPLGRTYRRLWKRHGACGRVGRPRCAL